MYKQLFVPLSIQLGHIILSCLWNLVGVYLLAHNLAALGPSASLTTAVLLLGLGVLLVLASFRSASFYVLVSSVLALGALSAIVNAFTQTPDSWPSEYWRIAGVMLNSVGLVGAVWGAGYCIKHIYSKRNGTYVP